MKNILFYSLGVIQIFVGIGAAVCGGVMIAVPSGELLHLSPNMLDGTPFSNFLVPGIILLCINGICQLAGGIITLRKHKYAGYIGAIFGIGLMIWIFVQVNMIGGKNILQYIYFFLGVAETALSFLIQQYLPLTKAIALTKNE
jgi:hypothetical protein